MTTTVPVQAASALHNANRAGKPSSNTSVTPFNALLSQEVAQYHTESGLGVDKTAATATLQNEHEVSADDKNQSEERACELINVAGTTDLLTLVADIAQLTATAPATATATATATSTAATTATTATATTATTATTTTASEVRHETLPDKMVSFDLGRGDLNGKTVVSMQDRTAPASGNAKQTSSSVTTFGAASVASTMLHSASPGPGTGLPNAFAQDSASVLAPASQQPVAPMQQITALFAAQNIAPASDKLMPPVGTPAWDQALGNKIIWLAGSDMQTASLTLNPPDLGPLEVVLNVSNNQASATFSAAQPEVRQALEAAMPKLREMMGEAGIALGQATVDAGTSRRQETADQRSGSPHGNSSRPVSIADTPGESLKRPVVTVAKGLVDTFA